MAGIRISERNGFNQGFFTLKGTREDGVRCTGRGGDRGEVIVEAHLRGDTGRELPAIAAEIARRGAALKSGDEDLEFDYTAVDDIPVICCHRAGARGLPPVLFHHGTTGSASDQLFAGIPLAEAGFLAVLVDARMHGRRQDPDFFRRFAPENYKRTYVEMLLGTAADCSTLLDRLADDPRADVDRAGISGISQGGFVTFMAITKDPRFRAAAPIVGSPDIEGRFGWDLPPERYDHATMALAREHSPLRNCAAMPPCALMVQNGALDELVPPDGARKLDAALRPRYADVPERFRYVEHPDLGHDHRPMMAAAIEWLRRWLGEG